MNTNVAVNKVNKTFDIDNEIAERLHNLEEEGLVEHADSKTTNGASSAREKKGFFTTPEGSVIDCPEAGFAYLESVELYDDPARPWPASSVNLMFRLTERVHPDLVGPRLLSISEARCALLPKKLFKLVQKYQPKKFFRMPNGEVINEVTDAVPYLNTVTVWEGVHVKLMHLVVDELGPREAKQVLLGLNRRIPGSVWIRTLTVDEQRRRKADRVFSEAFCERGGEFVRPECEDPKKGTRNPTNVGNPRPKGPSNGGGDQNKVSNPEKAAKRARKLAQKK